MSVVQPVLQPIPQAPFGAMVARQLSVWPFAARTTRLFLLVDPSLPGQTLRSGLLRAMQQGYFASDGYSQTRAVREAALAAHYVLRHHNRDVLPLDQINAATAVAAVRGDVAFVALAGHAAAFAWRDGELTGQRGILRLPRPLGLEQDPAIALWRTPLRAGDRLVLVCGATWRADSETTIHAILSSTPSTSLAEQQLAETLGDTRLASVLVVAPNTNTLRVPHLRLLGNETDGRQAGQAVAQPKAPLRRALAPIRWLFPVLGLLLLALVTLAALAMAPITAAPAGRVDGLSPRLAVRLGAAGTNMVDLAAGDGALYMLDLVDGVVQAFSLDGVDQQPGPESILAQAGTSLAGGERPMAQPVAIEYVPGAAGGLTIVDQSRTVVQLGEDGSLSPRDVPSSASWQALGALGTGASDELLFLDSHAHQLLAYPSAVTADPPLLLLDEASAPRIPFERIAQVVGAPDSVVVRLDDGSVHRVSSQGADQSLSLPPVGGRAMAVSAIASDRGGGLYLADPSDARVVQVSLDGNVLRQLRAPALAGVRAIDVSLDGRRLYALVASGVLVADIPAL